MDVVLPAVVSLGLILLSYLLGSIPFAVVISRLMGLQDPRSFGSGNPGATNVLRTGNKKAAVLTLFGDAFKGWLAVVLAAYISQRLGLSVAVVAACAVAAFIGHVYSLFLKFKGGKGVATALGVLLALEPWLAFVVAGSWLVIAFASRYSSLASVMAAALAPIYYIMGGKVIWPLHISYAAAILLISVLVLYRHKQNIARLLQGKESRIGGGKSQVPPPPPAGRKKGRR
ncbi:glycerol-3-phosphate 1-O-acyltransferase PlsY [Achromobacter sp. F4_2707]|uniref:glycerol-3-phosphate 1-O-acyltransferase PlsY n=1 Tax=Achromobacter sp. F4_2707 TaxID=3114286 RepID=UPI0039C6415E